MNHSTSCRIFFRKTTIAISVFVLGLGLIPTVRAQNRKSQSTVGRNASARLRRQILCRSARIEPRCLARQLWLLPCDRHDHCAERRAQETAADAAGPGNWWREGYRRRRCEHDEACCRQRGVRHHPRQRPLGSGGSARQVVGGVDSVPRAVPGGAVRVSGAIARTS